MRETTAAKAVPSVIAGKTSDSQPLRPLTGNHPRPSENTSTSNGPSQKLGIDTPSKEKPIAP